jgi:signal transduction histidine kinase
MTVPPWLAIGVIALAILPLTLRRSFPLLTLLTMTVALVVYRFLGVPESIFLSYAFLLGFFSAGVYSKNRWRDWVRGTTAVVVLGFLTYSVFFQDRSAALPARAALFQLSVILRDAFLIGAAWWIGEVFRIRSLREGQLRERTIQLEKERDDKARRAVFDERVRIARELHDVVAHHVSVMGIQAGAARRVLNQQPEKVTDILSQIESTSRQAVADMQKLLGFLRPQSQADELTPQPGLQQLSTLVEQARQAGLPVEVIYEGTACLLPQGLDLTIYRIVQEALTNTLKHAGTCKSTVTIRYLDNAIDLEVLDSGNVEINIDSDHQGRGIIGMRERVALHGGDFLAKKIPGVGFLVRARIPTTGRNK